MAKTDKPNPWRHAHMGLELAGAAIVLAAIGWFIDGRYGTGPWGAVIGLVVGFVGGFYLFIKDALQANRDNAAAWKRSQNPPPDKPDATDTPDRTPDSNPEREREP